MALAVALRGHAPLASLTIFEAPAVGFLRGEGDGNHYRDFRNLTDGYFRAYRRGNREAIAAMIDFYAGAGTFASWPQRVRLYAVETTPVNLLDWAGAYAFTPSNVALSALSVPTQITVGAMSHPAVQRANEFDEATHTRRRSVADRRRGALHDRHSSRAGSEDHI